MSVVGKRCKIPISKSQIIYISPFELVEMDLWGPTPISLIGIHGCIFYTERVMLPQYFLSFINLLKIKLVVL